MLIFSYYAIALTWWEVKPNTLTRFKQLHSKRRPISSSSTIVNMMLLLPPSYTTKISCSVQ